MSKKQLNGGEIAFSINCAGAMGPGLSKSILNAFPFALYHHSGSSSKPSSCKRPPKLNLTYVTILKFSQGRYNKILEVL